MTSLGPAASSADESRYSQLEDQFTECVQRGDAQALEQLQKLKPQFKMIAEDRGLLAIDARDYQNNLIPKAQKEIEDHLASAESAEAAITISERGAHGRLNSGAHHALTSGERGIDLCVGQ
jgi:hypothetical protein